MEPVLDDPGSERVPLDGLAAVHGHAVLAELVLARLQVGEDLARDLGEVAPVEEVVLLDEDLAEARLRCGGGVGWVGEVGSGLLGLEGRARAQIFNGMK